MTGRKSAAELQRALPKDTEIPSRKLHPQPWSDSDSIGCSESLDCCNRKDKHQVSGVRSIQLSEENSLGRQPVQEKEDIKSTVAEFVFKPDPFSKNFVETGEGQDSTDEFDSQKQVATF